MKYYMTKEKILLWHLSPDLCDLLNKLATNQSRDEVHTHVGKSSRICICCQIDLSNLDAAREHFKSSYHKKNLKKYLLLKTQISNDSVNNERSELNDDTVNIFNIKQYKHAKVYLDTGQDQLIAFNRFLLKNLLDTESNITKLCWAILMLSGGHFAGAIFEGPDLILHKTIHSYTVRSSKGKQQSFYDKKCINNLRSAGSSLRRYNEQSFMRYVQKTLSLWSNQLSACNFIFYKTTSLSKNILFGSKHPMLSSKDDRIFPITITTKKPTLSEVERVHQYLASVEVFRNEIKDNELNVHSKQIYAIDDCFCEIIDLNLKKQNFLQKLSTKEPKYEQNAIREFELHSNILSTENIAIMEKNTHINDEKLNNLQSEFLSETKNCKTQLNKQQKKLNFGANPNVGNKSGLTPLMICQKLNISDEIIECVDTYSRYYKNNANNSSSTLTSVASKSNSKELIKLQNNPKTTYNKKQNKSGKKEGSISSDYHKINICSSSATSQTVKETGHRKSKKKFQQNLFKQKKVLLKEEEEEAERRIKFLSLTETEKQLQSKSEHIKENNRCFNCGIKFGHNIPFIYNDNKLCSISCVKKYRKI